jgi:phage-related protein
VFFAGDHLEEKKITEVTTTALGPQVTWSPGIQTAFPSGAEVYRPGRKFKLFGNNAAPAFIKSTGSGSSFTSSLVDTDFTQASTTTLYLDSVVSDLKANTQVLVVIRGDSAAGDFNGLFTISAVSQAGMPSSGANMPVSGTVTRIDLQSPNDPTQVPHLHDIRKVQVYELTSGEITFSRRNFSGQAAAAPPQGDDPVTLSKGAVQVYSDEISATDLTVNSTAIIADDAGNAEQVTLTKITTFSLNLCESGVTIEFTPALTNTYSNPVLYGNVVKATHGETIKDETLGSGDGSKASQTFDLKKSPVTFTPDITAENGAKNSLQVTVNGVSWSEAENFFGAGTNDCIYVTSIDNDSQMQVEFGDGVYGSRLPTGVNNIHAKYRKGWGKDGSVAAGKLTTLLDAKSGLKSVTNPGASFGWADPETLSEARQNAPTTVLTFDRAVSLRDFENLARSYPGVGKARAAWVWNDEQQVIQLTCAASDGQSILPIQANLQAYLDARRDPNRQLEIVDFTPVGIKLHAYIVTDPAYDENTVLAEAQAAVGDQQLSGASYGFFAFNSLDLDEDIHLSEVYARLQGVTGVTAVLIDELRRKDAPAEKLKSIVPIGPSELAMISASSDVVIELKDEL